MFGNKFRLLSLVGIALLLIGFQGADGGTLLGSTFFGGLSKDGLLETQMAIDAQGNVFVAGRTGSSDLPRLPNCYDTTYNGGTFDVFVAKFSPDLTTLQALTYLGGSGDEGTWPGVALTLDAQGNVFVAFRTFSTDLVYTHGTPGGFTDIYIAKFDNNLQNLLSSRILGGSSAEYFVQLTVDASGDLLIAGTTASATTFPISPDAFQTGYGGGGDGPYPGDLFVCRLTEDLSTLLGSTFVGGVNYDYCEAIMTGADGSIYLCGWTGSANFPTTEGALSRVHGGGTFDAFVSRLSGDLTAMIGSTLLGGSGWDFGYGMTLDADGNPYVTGHTASANFPTTLGTFSPFYNGSDPPVPDGDDDAFITKLHSSMEFLLASTYLGSPGWEIGAYFAWQESGGLLVSGWTRSTLFPVSLHNYDPAFNGHWDIFVASVSSDLSAYHTGTYLGGSQYDVPCGMIVTAQGDLCLSATTNSTTYPTLSTSYDDSYNGSGGSWGENDGDSWGGDVALTILPGYYFADVDQDGLLADNCPETFNPDQEDHDWDGIGDSCDVCTDTDQDGFGDPGFPANTCPLDNCPEQWNADQFDLDQDDVGDECDNCLWVYNPDQLDLNGNGIGDACEGCCRGRVGDANNSGEDEPTISDVSIMIDAKFIAGTCEGKIDCLEEADINQSGGPSATCDDITISDISTLIDYLFITGPETATIPDCL